MPPTSCPDLDCWRDLLDGESSVGDREWLVRHLNACSSCQQAVEGLTSGTDIWVGAARALEERAPDPTLRRVIDELKQEGEGERPAVAPLPADFLTPPEAPGQLGRLGPYEVLGEIG